MNAAKELITNFVAGCAGGTACVYCGQPLDTVKVKLQTFPSLYKSALDCFRSTLKNEGIQGLYKGSLPALLCNVSENAVLFVALGYMKSVIGAVVHKHPEQLSNLENASAGSLASIFSAMVVCPTELIKCRMQAMAELQATGKVEAQRIGPWGVLRSMIKTNGILSPFQGLTSTWLREMPGYFLFFYGYEFTRGVLASKGQSKDDLEAWKTVIAGGTAGLLLWTAIFPIDVVKSRIQVLSAGGTQYGFTRTLRIIVRTEGVGALYSGLFPTIVRTYPANGALFLAYECARKNFGNAIGLESSTF
uniref:mitochondrial ornithine transporter 1 n=1 Tax=Ciona intestinalis TaxID=7719 RepID=UPI000180CE3E|nr:mitochondrial ornithine transporter 1 [Ciona intestinalis]|eukprot:XP_002132089.1 mitochondrial ornithine transporter 1 [Ciona intestinalis]